MYDVWITASSMRVWPYDIAYPSFSIMIRKVGFTMCLVTDMQRPQAFYEEVLKAQGVIFVMEAFESPLCHIAVIKITSCEWCIAHQ